MLLWLVHPVLPSSGLRVSSLGVTHLHPHLQRQQMARREGRRAPPSSQVTSQQTLLHSYPQGLFTCTPPPAGPALVSCSEEVQGPLSRVLQLVRDRDSSLTLLTLGLALPTPTGNKGQSGQSITPIPRRPHSRKVAEPALLHSLLGRLTCIATDLLC